QPVQRKLADHRKRRRNMAMRQGTFDLQFARPRPDHRAALEQGLQSFDRIARQLAQVGQGPLLRAAVLIALALAKQHRRRRTPVRNRLNEHSPNRITFQAIWESITWIQITNIFEPNAPHRLYFNLLAYENFRLMSET